MMTRSFPAFLAASALVAAATGCVDQPDEIAAALEEENGGLDTEDEAPMFDDAVAFTEASVEAPGTYADPFASDAETSTMFALPGAVGARVAMVWGQLPPDLSPEAFAPDWSGSLSVNRGAIVVRRTIGFEDATDRVLPRTDRTRVDFESITRPFADGLVLQIVDPDPDAVEPLTLTYDRIDGTSHTLELAELLAGPVVRTVDDQGDKIVVAALRRNDTCDHGFGRGRWHAVREGLGRMIGVIGDDEHNPIGHIRGIWGARHDGEQVFFGKYIDADGHFRGIFSGHYRDGDMVGHWLGRGGEVGRIQGRYEESAPGPRVGGHFMLRWAETSCAQDLPSDG
jgi:hypothetical protein